MTRFVEVGEQQAMYDLSAILIHQGSSTYAGHYIALIKDSFSGFWYLFNDEVVEKVDVRSLKFGFEVHSGSKYECH